MGVSMLWIALAGAFALALAMPQLLGTIELMGFSDRAGEIDPGLAMASAHPRQWLALLLPFLYGRPGYPNAYWAPTIYEFAIGHCYVGILPLIASLFCWLRRKGDSLDWKARERRFLVWFFTAVLAVGLIMSAGKYTPAYGFLHHWLPGLGHFRFPVKFYFFVAFALSMLGALGFQSLLDSREKDGQRAQIRLWWVAASCFGLFLLGYLICLFDSGVLIWLMANPNTPSVEQVNSARTDYTWAAVFTLLGLGLFGMLAFRRGSVRWVQGGIVAVAFINLCVISRQVQPTGPAGIYSRRPLALAKRLGTDPMYRYFSTYYGAQQYVYGDTRTDIWEWAVDSGATSHLQLEGLSSLTPGGLPLTRYTRFFGAMMSVPPPLQEKLADMLSLRYVIGGAPFEQILWGNASREVRIGERPHPLPRAFVVSRWRSVAGAEPVLQAIASESFDPHTEAIVESLSGETPPPGGSASSSRESAGEVRSFVDRGNSVTMEVVAKNRVLLILGDTWYPGWTATVDGVKSPIFQANYLFRGVFVEAGTHRIEFSFWPTHLTVGLWCFALGAAACVALGVAGRFSGRSVRTLCSSALRHNSAPLMQ